MAAGDTPKNAGHLTSRVSQRVDAIPQPDEHRRHQPLGDQVWASKEKGGREVRQDCPEAETPELHDERGSTSRAGPEPSPDEKP